MVVPPSAEVIQATLAPAFLVGGTSVFLNFTQNRLYRVLDRHRDRLVQRTRILRAAVSLGVLAVAFTVASAILVMASEMFIDRRLADFAPFAFALALGSFFLALLFVFLDTMASVAGAGKA